MKKLLGFITVTVMAMTLAACSGTNATLDAQDTTFLAVEINPGVEFVLDDEDNVESVLPLNDDAEVVLADLDLEGKPSDEALEGFIDAAVETGYIDVDSDENVITVTSDDEEEEESKKAKVQAILEERGIGAAIFGGGVDEEHRELAQEHGIGVGRARLISRAIEIDEDLTFEDALEMEHRDIMTILIDEHRARMDAFIDERKEEALETKENMRAMAQNHVQAHREAIRNGEKDIPDFRRIREDAKSEIEAIRSRFENRIQSRRENADDDASEATD
ncbi:MAG: anti-sigma-I factor RsgI family protein [Bacillota bacterium]